MYVLLCKVYPCTHDFFSPLCRRRGNHNRLYFRTRPGHCTAKVPIPHTIFGWTISNDDCIRILSPDDRSELRSGVLIIKIITDAHHHRFPLFRSMEYYLQIRIPNDLLSKLYLKCGNTLSYRICPLVQHVDLTHTPSSTRL